MNTNSIPNGVSAEAAHGSIKDYVGFKRKVSAEVKRLASENLSWATHEATELFLFIVREYHAQLAPGEKFRGADLGEIFARNVNMNGVFNRLRRLGLVVNKHDRLKENFFRDEDLIDGENTNEERLVDAEEVSVIAKPLAELSGTGHFVKLVCVPFIALLASFKVLFTPRS